MRVLAQRTKIMLQNIYETSVINPNECISYFALKSEEGFDQSLDC